MFTQVFYSLHIHTYMHTYIHTYIHTYLGSHWYPPSFCVWCSPAKFLLCWTGHLSLVPHCIHHDTSCIRVSVECNFNEQAFSAFFVDKGKVRIQAICIFRYSFSLVPRPLPYRRNQVEFFGSSVHLSTFKTVVPHSLKNVWIPELRGKIAVGVVLPYN